jgi:uncharacterized OB-fold protein
LSPLQPPGRDEQAVSAPELIPEPNDDSEPFWTGGRTGELLIHRCEACGHWFHPPAPVCFRCRSRQVGPEPVSGRATVASFTVNHYPWLESITPPYVVAIVELPEESGVRLITNIVDCPVDDVRIGMDVQVVFERRADVWIPLFRPVAA